MYFKKLIYSLFFIVGIILLTNCATSSAGISTSNIPITDQKYTVISPVEKTTYWITIDFGIIGFPLQKPPVNSLVNEALNETEADALINIRHWNDKIVILFVTINRFGLTAEAVRFETPQPPQNQIPKRR